ncbi:MAG: hypothetical protein ACREUA_07350 [Burkholderiales bacterium]
MKCFAARFLPAALFAVVTLTPAMVSGAAYEADPSNYRSILKSLTPGDVLTLRPGTYTDGLPLHDINGDPGREITIRGTISEPRPVFRARRGINTISIVDSSHITLQYLELDGQGIAVDAVKAEGYSEWAHHIRLDGLVIHGHGANQQVVGISTKCPAWAWVIRNNVIIGAGTGIYLGNSDGSAPFINGVIENNFVADTLGYNLQIKHQKTRPHLPGMPVEEGATVIRRNVFSKANPLSGEHLPRPNVLVGHFPLSGAGAKDIYLIHGNFFYQNANTGEALFQGEGNIAFYNNLLVNNHGNGVVVHPHNDVPRHVEIFQNTIVASGTGILLKGGHPDFDQRIRSNAVFAGNPIVALQYPGNFTADFSHAGDFLTNPFGPIGSLNLAPQPGTMDASPIIPTIPIMRASPYFPYPDAELDFDGSLRTRFIYGAYGDDTAEWPLQLAPRP